MTLLLPFIITCILIELTPGPNMAYLAILSLSHGRKAGLAALLGVALGLGIIGVASAFGLAAIIKTSPVTYEILRWGGAFYLLWLAWQGWHDEPQETNKPAIQNLSSLKYFWRGLITNLLNPKSAIFYIAILPDFIGATPFVLLDTLWLVFVYVSVATTIHLVIVLLAAHARLFLENSQHIRTTRRILAVLLAIVAVWFFLVTRYKP